MTVLSACRACGVPKPPSEFYQERHTLYVDKTCKACRIASQLRRYYAGEPVRAKLVDVLDGGDTEPFWRRVEKTFACWFWLGAKTGRFGYGVANLRNGPMAAHRLSWILTNGPIPDGLWVLHRCDNPPCVRPDHLFLGTTQDNTLDCVQKGRSKRCGLKGHRWTPESAAAAARLGHQRINSQEF